MILQSYHRDSAIPLSGYQKLIAFDPGGTTGVAIWQPNILNKWECIETLTITPTSLLDLNYLLSHSAPYPWAILSEHVQANNAQFDDIGIHIMGVLQYLCMYFGHHWYLQKPTFMKAPYLYATKWLNTIQPVHSRDACAHALAFLNPKYCKREYLNDSRNRT